MNYMKNVFILTIEKQNQILKYQSHHKSDNQRSHDEMEL